MKIGDFVKNFQGSWTRQGRVNFGNCEVVIIVGRGNGANVQNHWEKDKNEEH